MMQQVITGFLLLASMAPSECSSSSSSPSSSSVPANSWSNSGQVVTGESPALATSAHVGEICSELAYFMCTTQIACNNWGALPNAQARAEITACNAVHSAMPGTTLYLLPGTPQAPWCCQVDDNAAPMTTGPNGVGSFARCSDVLAASVTPNDVNACTLAVETCDEANSFTVSPVCATLLLSNFNATGL
jgi:hypothetical protein